MSEDNRIYLLNHLTTQEVPVRIFPDGSYMNPLRLTPVYSSKSFSGLNMLLPVDYSPAGGNFVTNALAENESSSEEKSADPFINSLHHVAKSFDRQLSVFPQEKIHLHTDKPYYISGERIWFRAHIVDAATHVPSFYSNSVYVELFDVRDSIVSRIKTGISNDLFSGYITIPEDAPEGDYTLRAYTNKMKGLDEDCFFMKNIHIGDPVNSIIQTLPEFEFLSDKKIGAGIRFSHVRSLGSVTPESVKISINNDKPMNLICENGLSAFSFNLPSTEKQRMMMLLDAVYDKKTFRQYIKIPVQDDDFDVSFYPEGGAVLAGCAGRIAFKAMQRDGTEINVSGTVYDQRGNEVTQFKTDVRGMGVISMQFERGEKYFAIVANDKSQSKRFELPVAMEEGYALAAAWVKDRLNVQVRHPGHQSVGDTLCLLVHTRGVVQDVRVLKSPYVPVIFPKEFFPSGVSHLLLLSKDMAPLSERLVFVSNDADHAIVESSADKENYSARSLVKYTVYITDDSGEPLRGNFSVSVTDDSSVIADSTSNILTSLLLNSDLKGYIPDPAYFFRKNDLSSVYALDLLMLTHGWRRYNTEQIVRNKLTYPDISHETGYELSGTVRYLAMGVGRPIANAGVSVISLKGDFAAETTTDNNGRFYLHDGEAPDGTRLIIQTAPQFRRRNLELILDRVSFPKHTVIVLPSGVHDRIQFSIYADKAEQQYEEEYGNRIQQLSEVTITAQRKQPVDYSFFYKAKDAAFAITEEDLEKYPVANMSNLLLRIPGVRLTDKDVFHGSSTVTLMVDDVGVELEDVLRIDPYEVGQIDFLRGTNAAIFTGYIDGKVIAIFTKRGKPSRLLQKTPNVKSVMPLGFQRPVEFYSPKYDTPAQNTKPDLRTTIHWQPNITTDDKGTASFSFYTADTPTTYSVVIEGTTAEGKIVYKRDHIVVNY